MSTLNKVFFSLFLVFFIILLTILVIKTEEKNAKYNIIISQDKYRYRTDKFQITSDGVKFFDNQGNDIYIKGNYIIEKNEP